ncbi:MAG: right-handed parallel beta-helix repeat-containing protein [Phycisphaerales bacterium]
MLVSSAILGPNVYFAFQPGAEIAVQEGQTLTIDSPANVLAAPRQRIFAVGGDIRFGRPGCVYPQWWGADDTGNGDSTREIQAALDALESAGGGALDLNGTFKTTRLLTDGSYYYALWIPNHTRVFSSTGSGRFVGDKTIGTENEGYSQFLIGIAGKAPPSDITIEGLTFDGGSAATTKGLGVAFFVRISAAERKATRIRFIGNTCLGLRWSAMYWLPSGGQVWATVDDLEIRHNRIIETGGHGVAGRHASHVWITENYIERGGAYGIHGSLGIDVSGGNTDAVVSNNVLNDCGRGIKLESSEALNERAVVSGNIITGGNNTIGYGLRVNARSVVVTGNVITGHKGEGINLSVGSGEGAPLGADGVVLTGNVIRDIGPAVKGSPGYGLFINESERLNYPGVVVNAGCITAPSDAAVEVRMSNVTLSGIKIVNFPEDKPAIRVSGDALDGSRTVSNVRIVGCDIQRAQGDASVIELSSKKYRGLDYGARLVLISGNYITGGRIDAQYVDYLTVTDNQIYGQIRCRNSTHVAVAENIVSFNGDPVANPPISLLDCDYCTSRGNVIDAGRNLLGGMHSEREEAPSGRILTSTSVENVDASAVDWRQHVTNIPSDGLSFAVSGLNIIDSSRSPIAGPLADGTQVGQLVRFVCKAAGNNIDIVVSRHVSGDSEVIRLDAAKEWVELVWDGVDWVEIGGRGQTYP